MTREDEIRMIAYSLWEEEKCPAGCDCDHWFQAEIIWKKQQQQKKRPVKSGSPTKTNDKPAVKATTNKKK